LSAASDPARFDRLLAAADRAEPFDEDGWPLPVDGSRSGGGEDETSRQSPRFWPALAAAAAVVLIVALGFFLMPGSSSGGNANGTPRPSGSTDPDASDPPSDPSSPSDTPTPTRSTSPSPSESSLSPSPHSASPARRSPRPTPSRPASPTAPTHTVPAGRLAVSPGSCALSARTPSCGITVVAVGGPVTWSVGASPPLAAQGGGTLRPGGSGHATITLTACEEAGSGTVAVTPGGSVAVSWTCG
ncbi:hypothetical protein AB0J52_39400, partial [Spirillospora sp. NPDC049652]